MGVIDYNKDSDIDPNEQTENDINQKLTAIQNQLSEFNQLLRDIKRDIAELKKDK